MNFPSFGLMVAVSLGGVKQPPSCPNGCRRVSTCYEVTERMVDFIPAPLISVPMKSFGIERVESHWRFGALNYAGPGRAVPFSASVVTRSTLSRLPAVSIVFTSSEAGRRVRRISVGGLP